MWSFSEVSEPLDARQLWAILSIAIIRPRAQIEDGLIKRSPAQMTKDGLSVPMTFLSTVGDGRGMMSLRKGQAIYAQGECS